MFISRQSKKMISGSEQVGIKGQIEVDSLKMRVNIEPLTESFNIL